MKFSFIYVNNKVECWNEIKPYINVVFNMRRNLPPPRSILITMILFCISTIKWSLLDHVDISKPFASLVLKRNTIRLFVVAFKLGGTSTSNRVSPSKDKVSASEINHKKNLNTPCFYIIRNIVFGVRLWVTTISA